MEPFFIKKEQLIEVGGYNENFYYAQDYKLMTDLISKNKRFRIIKEPLYFKHEGQYI